MFKSAAFTLEQRRQLDDSTLSVIAYATLVEVDFAGNTRRLDFNSGYRIFLLNLNAQVLQDSFSGMNIKRNETKTPAN
jgi:hypothetical protein